MLVYFAFFRFAAQYAFIRSAWAFRRAALWRLRFGAEITGAAGDVAMAFGGLPGRFAPPWSASIARFNLSRSAISRAMMCSVGMNCLG